MKEFLKRCDELIADPSAEKIEYTISENYVGNLTEVFGIKEFIANFYDANGDAFEMNYDQGVLELRDENDGIDIKFMIIGNSGSRENEQKIGEHGEGFKVGALTILRGGGKVLIETVGYTIAFGIEKSELLGVNVMYAKYKANNNKQGTAMYLQCKNNDFEKAKNMFLHLSAHKKITDQIIATEAKEKNVYLNGLSHVQKKAFFAYNIKEKNLVSNRDRNFIQPAVLEKHLIQIYNALKESEAIRAVMAEVMENRADYDRMLESKIFGKLSLSASQKSLYRSALKDNEFFVLNKKPFGAQQNGASLVEVSEKLFRFLNYIGANVLYENGDVGADSVIAKFQLEADKMPKSEDVEIELSKFVNRNVSLRGEVLEHPFFEWFDLGNIEDMIKRMKIKYAPRSLYGNNREESMIHNLILLAGVGAFESEIALGKDRYKFEGGRIGKEIAVFVKKTEDRLPERKLALKRTQKVLDGKSALKQEENFIYVNGFCASKIDSLYSYNIKGEHVDHWGYSSHVAGIIDFVFFRSKKTMKSFIRELLQTSGNVLYEHETAPFGHDEFETAKKLFEEEFPRKCLKSDENYYNKVAQEKYHFQIHEVESYVLRNSMLEAGLPTSKEIFIERQKAEIIEIEPTPALKKAVEIIKQRFPEVQSKVAMSEILPDGRESMNKGGVIYISNNVSAYPEYLAALIRYEHAQIDLNVTSPSHGLQHELTENMTA